MSLFDELKRRNVFRAGIAYAVIAWLILQVADVVLPILGSPDWVFRGLLLLLAYRGEVDRAFGGYWCRW